MTTPAKRAEREPGVFSLAWSCASLTLTALALISLTGRLGSIRWNSFFEDVAGEYRRIVHSAFDWIAAWFSFQFPPTFYDGFLLYTLFGAALAVSGTLTNRNLKLRGAPVYGLGDEPIELLEDRPPGIDYLVNLTMIFGWGVLVPLSCLFALLKPLVQLRLGSAVAALAGTIIMLVQGIIFSVIQASVFFAALAANYVMSG